MGTKKALGSDISRKEDWQIHKNALGATRHQNLITTATANLGQATVMGAMPCGFRLVICDTKNTKLRTHYCEWLLGKGWVVGGPWD